VKNTRVVVSAVSCTVSATMTSSSLIREREGAFASFMAAYDNGNGMDARSRPRTAGEARAFGTAFSCSA
jgi:hypothetical protein